MELEIFIFGDTIAVIFFDIYLYVCMYACMYVCMDDNFKYAYD
jgi:hypothetical protein